jgi:hypothetical protein
MVTAHWPSGVGGILIKFSKKAGVGWDGSKGREMEMK